MKPEYLKWAMAYIKQHGQQDFINLLKNKLRLDINLPMDALWAVHALNETKKTLLLPRYERVQLAISGKTERLMVDERWNKITDLYTDALIANNAGSPTVDQHLKIDYVALGRRDCKATGIVPAVTDTQLGREYFRQVPDEVYKSGSTTVVILYLDAASANPTNTTVASGASTTVFDVQSGQGANYAPNDTIRVFTSTYEYVTVLSVSGDTITLKGTTPLSVVPTAGMVVERGCGEVGLFCGQATGSANSGTLVNHGDLRFFKKSDNSMLVECHLNYIKG